FTEGGNDDVVGRPTDHLGRRDGHDAVDGAAADGDAEDAGFVAQSPPQHPQALAQGRLALVSHRSCSLLRIVTTAPVRDRKCCSCSWAVRLCTVPTGTDTPEGRSGAPAS